MGEGKGLIPPNPPYSRGELIHNTENSPLVSPLFKGDSRGI
ncbi:NAD kinase [Crocosphaera watsonii WH 0401]|uniref:NAD kinase n=1 Tax=Crocosphaera watsonii WH 0401 TaxID=555881 RepID=T2J871_CROWT|nr:NAD kinase [Crocosphaera watsonii WH 0401]